MAKQLQADEMATMQLLQGMQSASVQPGPELYAFFKRQGDKYRMDCEGPPDVPQTTITAPCGTQHKMRRAKKGWDENDPVVSCAKQEILAQLVQLGSLPLPNGETCSNRANETLLKLLCDWRRHVIETYFEMKKPGEGWKRTSICTSEQTWLGRSSTKGGTIGTISATVVHINSISLLLALKKEGGAKGLSAGFAMLLQLRLNW